jgi:hypothetical protein
MFLFLCLFSSPLFVRTASELPARLSLYISQIRARGQKHDKHWLKRSKQTEQTNNIVSANWLQQQTKK